MEAQACGVSYRGIWQWPTSACFNWSTMDPKKAQHFKGSAGRWVTLTGLKSLETKGPLQGPVEDTEWYLLWLHRLNRGMDTRHWRVYERKEEPNGVRLVLSIDTA